MYWGRFRIYGLGAEGLCCSASEIKPVPLPDTKKISPSAGGQILYLVPLHEFTIKNKMS